MTSSRGPALAWWAAVTIFVSAFLLFQVQPVISKTILPWFGGSPAVWTTCVLFFQLVLLAGYGYAHALIRYVSPKWQGMLHGGLLVLAICTLPITPGEWLKPRDGSLPSLRILFLLAVEVGLPYFLLSSSGPLVQAWFARMYPGTSPYRLYALSNVGSLLALLTYPVLIEPLMGVYVQGVTWSFTFIGFALLAGLLGWQVSRLVGEVGVPAAAGGSGEEEGKKGPAKAGTPTDDAPISGPLMLAWIALPALASMLFLATTNHLCQDIAVVPFMWIVPLSLYLISFILCFDSEIWYQRKIWGLLGLVGMLVLCGLIKGDDWELGQYVGTWALQFQDSKARFFRLLHWLLSTNWAEEFEDNLAFQALVYVILLFIVCMLCHGELVKLKPRPKQLTLYYLMISVGGALGGLFVALICPLIFRQHYELSIGLVGGYLVAWIAIINDGRSSWLDGKQWLQWTLAFAIMGGVVFVVSSTRPEEVANKVEVTRNFYGTLTVLKHLKDEDDDGINEEIALRLRNGGILHGYQFTDDVRRYAATTYYVIESGAGVAVNKFPRATDAQGKDNGIRVGVVGLGVGTMAAHAQRDDVYRFYEIDPKVVAMSDKYFTFRSDAEDRGAKTEVVSGDARIQMELEPDQNYDVIILDAFSGDAIPAHLLTVESLEIYKRHLRKDASGKIMGILAVHISNRHLDLAPVVAALARRNKLDSVLISADDDPLQSEAFTSSDWVLLTQNEEFLVQDLANSSELEVALEDEVLWTDQHSSLLPILKSEWVTEWREWWRKKPVPKPPAEANTDPPPPPPAAESPLER